MFSSENFSLGLSGSGKNKNKKKHKHGKGHAYGLEQQYARSSAANLPVVEKDFHSSIEAVKHRFKHGKHLGEKRVDANKPRYAFSEGEKDGLKRAEEVHRRNELRRKQHEQLHGYDEEDGLGFFKFWERRKKPMPDQAFSGRSEHAQQGIPSHVFNRQMPTQAHTEQAQGMPFRSGLINVVPSTPSTPATTQYRGSFGRLRQRTDQERARQAQLANPKMPNIPPMVDSTIRDEDRLMTHGMGMRQPYVDTGVVRNPFGDTPGVMGLSGEAKKKKKHGPPSYAKAYGYRNRLDKGLGPK